MAVKNAPPFESKQRNKSQKKRLYVKIRLYRNAHEIYGHNDFLTFPTSFPGPLPFHRSSER